MSARTLAAVGALVLAAAGCRDDAESPTGPTSTTSQPSAAAAVAPTITLVSGNGPIGGRDPENLVRDGDDPVHPAYILEADPAYAPPIPGSQWIGAQPGFLRSSAVIEYHRTFTLPAEVSERSTFTLQLHADNVATVYLNGTQIGQLPFEDTPPNYAGPPETFTAPARLLRNGDNTLVIEVFDFGVISGLDYKATILIQEPEALSFRQVSAGASHTCGVTSDELAYCWGANDGGQLGNGTDIGPEVCQTYYVCGTRPVAVVGGLRFRQVSAGPSHTCGVTVEELAYCWGSNGLGQLGDGTRTDRQAPTPVAGGLRFRQVSAGSNGYTCGLTTEGQAYCWGENWGGQLGDGTLTYRITPVAVLHTWRRYRQISTGHHTTCAVSTADEAFCWGWNRYGAVGDSTEVRRRKRPYRVAGGLRFRQVDVGERHSCGVTTDDRAFCWGDGTAGQIGNGKSYYSYWPRAVAGQHSFVEVTAGARHTCGRTPDNRAYCWGSNGIGQLGNPSVPYALKPVAVRGGRMFSQLTAGDWHTCGMTTGQAAYCWGSNWVAALGDATLEDRTVPSPVAGPL
jgi:alpha-tubulin suppressor-like RCC1 family protein